MMRALNSCNPLNTMFAVVDVEMNQYINKIDDLWISEAWMA